MTSIKFKLNNSKNNLKLKTKHFSLEARTVNNFRIGNHREVSF